MRFNSSSKELIESAREFSEHVLRPNASRYEEKGVPTEVVQEMADRGFLGAAISSNYGGGNLDAYTHGRITEEIGKGCSSVRALMTVHGSLISETLEKLGNKEQKQRYLPQLATGDLIGCFALSEPEAGSDAASIKTNYVQKDGAYVINGSKKWISYAAIADLFLVFACCEGVMSAFFVERDTPGVSTRPMRGLMASKGAHLAEIEFENVVVPKENMLGHAGMGFSFVANTALFFGRYSIAWAGLAITSSAVDEMVTYATSRKQFGRKIGENQLVQGIIADNVVALHASRALCEKIAKLKQSNDDSVVIETEIAKYFCAKSATAASSAAVQVLGANGCLSDYIVERQFREAKVLEIIEGTSQIQQMVIANFGLRNYRRKAEKINLETIL